MIAVVGVWLVALRLGVSFDPTVFNLGAIPSNLALVQAWGTQPTVSWNFPSWSISAEWFAYLLFPAAAALAVRTARLGRINALGCVFILYGAMFAFAASKRVPFNEMTAQIGALRIVPAFFYGAVLYVLGRTVKLAEQTAWLGLGASAAWIVVSTSLRLSDAAIWPALGGLVFCLAETAKSRNRGGLAAPALVYLGEISYGMYMVHMPVDLIYFHAIQRFAPHPAGVFAAMLWLGVIVVVIVAAAASFHLIEHPARVWLRRRDPFARGAQQPVMG